MPSQEPTAETVRDVQPSGTGQNTRQPSVRDVLASCSAANAISTPPDRTDAESADDAESAGPEQARPDAA